MDLDKRLFWLVGVIIILFAFVMVNFANTSLTGQLVQQRAVENNQSVTEYLNTLDFLKSELGDSDQGLQSCYDLNKELLDKLEVRVQELTDCKTEKEQQTNSYTVSLHEKDLAFLSMVNKKENEKEEIEDKNREEVSGLNQTIEGLEEEIEDLLNQISDKDADQQTLQDRYDLLVDNMGHSVCCKSKFDNPSIKYYKVENDKILCSTESGKNLTCSF